VLCYGQKRLNAPQQSHPPRPPAHSQRASSAPRPPARARPATRTHPQQGGAREQTVFWVWGAAASSLPSPPLLPVRFALVLSGIVPAVSRASARPASIAFLSELSTFSSRFCAVFLAFCWSFSVVFVSFLVFLAYFSSVSGCFPGCASLWFQVFRYPLFGLSGLAAVAPGSRVVWQPARLSVVGCRPALRFLYRVRVGLPPRYAHLFRVHRFSGLPSFPGWVLPPSPPARRTWFAPWLLRPLRFSCAFRVAPARHRCCLRALGVVVVRAVGRSVRCLSGWASRFWCSCPPVCSRPFLGAAGRWWAVGGFSCRLPLPCFHSHQPAASGLFYFRFFGELSTFPTWPHRIFRRVIHRFWRSEVEKYFIHFQ